MTVAAILFSLHRYGKKFVGNSELFGNPRTMNEKGGMQELCRFSLRVRCGVLARGTNAGVFKLFSWQPKFQHHNLTRPKAEKNVNLPKLVRGVILSSFTLSFQKFGLFWTRAPQVRTCMTFTTTWFMNFEEGFNKILNYIRHLIGL